MEANDVDAEHLCCAVQEQVVCRSNLWKIGEQDMHTTCYSKTYGNSVFPRMPARVQDLLIEIQGLHRHSLSKPTWPSILHSELVPGKRATNLLGLESRLVCLQNHVVLPIGVVYPEVVVV